jgi:hypothetical protein
LAYVDFARAEPGVFRLVFGLTEGHENAPDLQTKGESCFGVVVQAAAACLDLPPNDPQVQRSAYMLWSFVHGHSFQFPEKPLFFASSNLKNQASQRLFPFFFQSNTHR